jgi:hypothetical protein
MVLGHLVECFGGRAKLVDDRSSMPRRTNAERCPPGVVDFLGVSRRVVPRGARHDHQSE